MWRDGRDRQRSLRDLRSVQCQGPGCADFFGGICKVHVVFHSEDLPSGVVRGAQRSVNVFVLQKTCVRRPVRIDQSVQAEIPVVLQLAVISAVPVHGLPVFGRSLVDRVVAPLPDKAAAERRVMLCKIQIFLEIAGTVTHGMAVFHQQKRFVRLIVQIVRHLIESGIHAAEEIDIGDIKLPDRSRVESTLIGRQPCRIVFFGPVQSFLKSAAVTAFVAHGPYQYGGAIPVPYDHRSNPVQGRLNEIRVVGYTEMHLAHPLHVILLSKCEGACPMAFVIGLVDDIETQFVTELIKPG